MRIENYIHIPHVMLYNFEKGWNSTQSFRDISKLFSRETIKEWIKKFGSGDKNLEDEVGRDRHQISTTNHIY